MASLFVISAAVGATILVLQFLLGLVGLGGDALGVDAPHDFGHDFGGVDHDFSGADHDVSGDAHAEISHDASATGDHTEAQHSETSQTHHGSAWLFRALSLRTITAALTFFGLAGLAAQSADYPPFESLAIAIAAGVGALYAVYAMLSATRSVQADGTVRIRRALGKEATVYLRIPGKRSGAGKIQMNLQNRTVEYLAMTPDDAIPSGAIVVVTDVLGSDTVQVEPVTKSL